jgi:hypothetical protein
MLARRLTTILPPRTLAEAIETARIHRVVERTGFAEDAAALARQIEQSVVLETLAPNNDRPRRTGVIHAGQYLTPLHYWRLRHHRGLPRCRVDLPRRVVGLVVLSEV